MSEPTGKANPDAGKTQQELLVRYRELWVDFSAGAALIETLQARQRDIQRDQRRIANLIAQQDAEARQS